ncbi:MAG TPA: fructosamine kinase family protein [Solirubrobacteraceae bacterium]|nr:fructosamine kinase family protein [Solirubrobacteraceae bacterium]
MTLPPGARDARPVGGGYINHAYRARLARGADAFVKTREGPQPGEYAAEAEGLRWLAEAGGVRTPAVLEVADDYLALEWIDAGALSAEGAEELGRGLAVIHGAGAPCFGDPGFIGLALLGTLSLPNDPAADWGEFYATRRLLPLAREARDRERLSARGAADVERVCEEISERVGPAEPPSRLHGDLWLGNVLAGADGRPWLIDPWAHGGHREVDLAMLRLFGSPPERTFAAYEEVLPLADGWRDRVALYQLLPLLVHAALFGGSYVDGAERAARAIAAT